MPLQFDPNRDEFEAFVGLQLGIVGLRFSDLERECCSVYSKLERQFTHTRSKYFVQDNRPVLRLGHNAQYTILLYELSRAAFVTGRRVVADKLYTLLRMVSSADIYYEVELPELWGCDHPLGSVIGRGQFEGDATFFFSQNCNIGNNGGVYPRVLGNLLMMPNSSLLGETHVTGNVILSNGTCAIDAGDLSDCIVFGRSPNLTVRHLEDTRFRELYILVLPQRG